MNRILALYKKEVRSYFVSPLFYVVAAVFLCLTGFFFYSDLNFFLQFGFGMDIMNNFFQLLFVDISRVMLITVPMLTMRLFAEERKLGTIELLFTYPMRDREIYLGKFLAAATVFLVMLGVAVLYPAYLYSIQSYPFQVVVAGFFGLALLGMMFIAVGLFVSSITDSQVVAGVGSVGMLLMFWVMTWNEASGSDRVMRVIKGYSTFEHFTNFSKGVIDSTDVLYFVFVVGFFANVTLRSLESRRWRGKR